MAKNRLTIIGLENGQKRTLVWEDNELYGDEDLKERFIAVFRSIPEERLEDAIHSAFDICGDHILVSYFDDFYVETLDVYAETILSDAELEEHYAEWAQDSDSIPIEDKRLQYTTFERNKNYGPPHYWSQIEPYIKNPFVPEQDVEVPSAPEEKPKCPKCLQPMSWILCGIPEPDEDEPPMYCGWLPICVPCRRWKRIEGGY